LFFVVGAAGVWQRSREDGVPRFVEDARLPGLDVHDLDDWAGHVEAREIVPHSDDHHDTQSVDLELGRQTVQRIVGDSIVASNRPESSFEREVLDRARHPNRSGRVGLGRRVAAEQKDERCKWKNERPKPHDGHAPHTGTNPDLSRLNDPDLFSVKFLNR
jgi:hypothetical protein